MNKWKRLLSFCEQRWEARRQSGDIPDELKIHKISSPSFPPIPGSRNSPKTPPVKSTRKTTKTPAQQQVDDEFWKIVDKDK